MAHHTKQENKDREKKEMKKLIAVMAAFAVLFCFACANMRVVHEIEVGT